MTARRANEHLHARPPRHRLLTTSVPQLLPPAAPPEPKNRSLRKLTRSRAFPQGFDADHPEIALLRLRNYTLGRPLDEAEVTAADFLDRVARLLKCIKPFVSLRFSFFFSCEDPSSAASLGGFVVRAKLYFVPAVALGCGLPRCMRRS